MVRSIEGAVDKTMTTTILIAEKIHFPIDYTSLREIPGKRSQNATMTLIPMEHWQILNSLTCTPFPNFHQFEMIFPTMPTKQTCHNLWQMTINALYSYPGAIL